MKTEIQKESINKKGIKSTLSEQRKAILQKIMTEDKELLQMLAQ